MATDFRPPWFPFYVLDFASDGVVELMSTEQIGAYILLLCKAWREDPPASLPTDDAKLARWARVSPGRWAELKDGVLAAFRLGTDSRWHQRRMRIEFDNAMRMHMARAMGGKAAASKRFGKLSDSSAIAQLTPSSSSPNASPVTVTVDVLSLKEGSAEGNHPPPETFAELVPGDVREQLQAWIGVQYSPLHDEYAGERIKRYGLDEFRYALTESIKAGPKARGSWHYLDSILERRASGKGFRKGDPLARARAAREMHERHTGKKS